MTDLIADGASYSQEKAFMASETFASNENEIIVPAGSKLTKEQIAEARERNIRDGVLELQNQGIIENRVLKQAKKMTLK